MAMSLTDLAQFANGVLAGLGAPATASNVQLIENWASNNENTAAAFNPLATKQKVAGSYDLPGNSPGDLSKVQQYANMQDGITATVKTLKNGYYSDILAAFKAGNASEQNASGALKQGLKTWSGQGYVQVNGSTSLSPEQYADTSATGTAYRNAALAPKPTLDRNSLAATYGFAASFFNSDKGLSDLLSQAVQEGWDAPTFQAHFQASPWYQAHNESARQYLELKLSSPADYAEQLNRKTADVMAQAVQMGSQLDADTAKGIADQAMQFGWDSTQLGQALSTHVHLGGGGNAADTENQMRTYLSNMGVKYGDDALSNDLQRIEGGKATYQDFQNNIRTIAESAFPAYAQQLQNGKSVNDIASPYLQSMASILEVNPNTLSVNDPTIRQALTSTDAKGQPVQTGLWDFEKSLMQDPRWQYTKNATDTTYSTIHKIGTDFGFLS